MKAEYKNKSIKNKKVARYIGPKRYFPSLKRFLEFGETTNDISLDEAKKRPDFTITNKRENK